MHPTTQVSMQRAWCEYRHREYGEAYIIQLPSDNFKHGYLMGRRDALAEQWHMVDEELPETDNYVLVRYRDLGATLYAIAYYDGEDWYTTEGSHIRPTHWIPIPQLHP